MLRNVLSFIKFHWSNLMCSIFVGKSQIDPNQEFVLYVDEARREWHWANDFAQEAHEDNLIDQAIYSQSAAERKYVHLLKQAKKEGIKADFDTIVSLALSARNKGNWGVKACRQKLGKSF